MILQPPSFTRTDIFPYTTLFRSVLLLADLFIEDAVFPGNRGNLLRRPGEADDARIEGRDVLGESFRCVAFRIQADEKRLNGIGDAPKHTQGAGDVGKGRRADGRALAEAEEHEQIAVDRQSTRQNSR